MRSSLTQTVKKKATQVKIITTEVTAEDVIAALCEELEQARQSLQKTLASHDIYAKRINKKD